MSAETQASAPKPSLGQTLRATREFRRVGLERASELLRIEPKFLVALEEERFEAIGPPVFAKGYLKLYAELLGLDPRPLVEELRERMREEPPLQARRSAEYEKGRSNLALFGVAAVVVVLVAATVLQLGRTASEGAASATESTPTSPATPDDAGPAQSADAAPFGSRVLSTLGAAVRLGRSSGESAQSTDASNAEPATAAGLPASARGAGGDGAAALAGSSAATAVQNATTAPAPVDTSARAPVETSARVPAETSTPAPAEASARSPVETSPRPRDQATAGQGEVSAPARSEATAGQREVTAVARSETAAVQGEPVSAQTAAAAGPTEAAASQADFGGLVIELGFTEDSWTEVTTVGGDRLFYGLVQAGAEERIRTDGEVSVLLGNANGVTVRVNGEPFAYPAGSRRGALARFRLSPPED